MASGRDGLPFSHRAVATFKGSGGRGIMTKECHRANMEKFLEALEFGGYEQGSGQLRHGEKYCCLGVACSIASRMGVKVEITEDGHRTSCDCGQPGCEDEENEISYLYGGEVAYLPPQVQAWLGVDVQNPVLAGRTAAWWNDFAGLNFRGIAQLFRHEYLDAGEDRDPDWTEMTQVAATVFGE